jgi:hypothetical protein
MYWRAHKESATNLPRFDRSRFAVKTIFLLKNFLTAPRAVTLWPCEVRLAHFSPYSIPHATDAGQLLWSAQILKATSFDVTF